MHVDLFYRLICSLADMVNGLLQNPKDTVYKTMDWNIARVILIQHCHKVLSTKLRKLALTHNNDSVQGILPLFPKLHYMMIFKGSEFQTRDQGTNVVGCHMLLLALTTLPYID